MMITIAQSACVGRLRDALAVAEDGSKWSLGGPGGDKVQNKLIMSLQSKARQGRVGIGILDQSLYAHEDL